MFTGLVEEVGTIRSITPRAGGLVLAIACRKVLEGTKLGDSIAVSGACLTVTKLGADFFEADVTEETVRRTAFISLRRGASVHLERALRLGDRLGGHIVSGHIDGVGHVESLAPRGNSTELRISFAPEKMKYILEKGSVAVDGVSLTVAARDGRSFMISVIPTTGTETALLHKKPGEPVNIECDMLGKYVEQLLGGGGGVTMDMLKNFGLSGGHYGI